jgi:hypothetical protein
VNSRRHSRRLPRLVLALMAVLALAGCSGGQDGAGSDGPDHVKQPNETSSSGSHDAEPNATGIFADIHGWIVYGGDDGIWAVDPSGPADQKPKLVTDRPGQPLGWSSDGTRLLVARSLDDDGPGVTRFALLVLDADDTETKVARGTHRLDGSISSDGTHVIYSDPFSGNAGIYSVGADGGTARLLHRREPQPNPEPAPGEAPAMFDQEAHHPVFSPDSSQIAYFDGYANGVPHRLRVTNADDTASRGLHAEGPGGLAWSPDGQRLLFHHGRGIWVIGIDGSGLAKVVDLGGSWSFPSWSPDGSRIFYERGRTLYVANADGTQATSFPQATLLADASSGWRRSAIWNPLPLEGGAE